MRIAFLAFLVPSFSCKKAINMLYYLGNIPILVGGKLWEKLF